MSQLRSRGAAPCRVRASVRALLAATTATALFAACGSSAPGALLQKGSSGGDAEVGGPGEPTGPGSTPGGAGSEAQLARDFFEQNVSPILDDGAGQECAACHSSAYAAYPGAPHFLGDAPSGYYDALVANTALVNAAPGNSLLVTKGPHAGIPYFGAAQLALVTEWLTLEAALRFGGEPGTDPVPTGPTCQEMLQKVADCMTLETWQEHGMPEVADQPNIAKDGCYGCHKTGLAAAWFGNPDDIAEVLTAFEKTKTLPTLAKLVACEIDPDTGALVKLVQAHRWRDKGKAPTLHPKYILDPAYQENIDAWFEATLEQCGMAAGAGQEGGGGGGGAGAGS